LRAAQSGPASPWRRGGRRRASSVASGPCSGFCGGKVGSGSWAGVALRKRGNCTSPPALRLIPASRPPPHDASLFRLLLPTFAILAHPPFLPSLIDTPLAPTPTQAFFVISPLLVSAFGCLYCLARPSPSAGVCIRVLDRLLVPFSPFPLPPLPPPMRRVSLRSCASSPVPR
jgi:hypothetical protein